MNKIKALALLALLIVSPLTLAAGSSGFPSSPTFRSVDIKPAPGAGAYTNYYSMTNATRATNNPVSIVRLGVNDPVEGALSRWSLRKDSTLESGVNACTGSDFQLESFNDTNGHLGYPININRCSGLITIGDAAQAGSLKVVAGADPFGIIEDGSITLYGKLISLKTVTAGYNRIGPSLVWRTAYPTLAALTDNTCTAIALPHADAKLTYVDVNIAAVSANAVGLRIATARAYSDSGCTSLLDTQSFDHYEHVAVAAGAPLGQTIARLRVNSAANFWIKTTGSAAIGFPSQATVGYKD